MSLSTLRAHQRWLAPAVLLLAIAAAAGTQTAFAKVARKLCDILAALDNARSLSELRAFPG